MMLLYESGIASFSYDTVSKIHKELFSDVYEWAGKYRIINIQKREDILAGKSVWYSNYDDIENDLRSAWNIVRKVNWDKLSKDDFAANIARCFSKLWQIHPFREGNTRTIVMLITLFTESHGYYFDQELMSSSAGYVRNAFVLASLGEYSEYEHLEKILKDAISVEPIQNNSISDSFGNELNDERYQKYATKDYKPAKHEYIE